MAKYTCSKTKDEILEIIAEEFRKVNKDYDDAMQNDNDKLKERNQGRYVAMFDLLHKLEIYEKERSKITSIEKSKEDARNLNELTDHLIKLLESDDKRFSFEFCAGGTMEIYDKEKEIGYAVHIAPIEYDKNGNAINL